jgi:hypothetical protein
LTIVNLENENLSNSQLLQVFHDGYFISFSKNEAKEVIPDDFLNSFQKSDLRGWDANIGYQYVLFGRYYQDYNDQPILWRVLGVKNGRALLLSELILDTRPFDDSSNEWESSDLRSWLNKSFYKDTFSSDEQTAILSNGDIGKVFLLSRGELSTASYGFNTNIYQEDPNRSAAGSIFAYSNNLWKVQTSDYTNYYARSKANSKNVDLVASNGKFVLARIDRDNVGIRPAVWVDVAMLPFTNGAGTMEYPFQ